MLLTTHFAYYTTHFAYYTTHFAYYTTRFAKHITLIHWGRLVAHPILLRATLPKYFFFFQDYTFATLKILPIAMC